MNDKDDDKLVDAPPNGESTDDTQTEPKNESALLSTGDVARLADVTSSTVSNWRRPSLESGFPEPVTESGARPLFRKVEVVRWLAENEGKFGASAGPRGRYWVAASSVNPQKKPRLWSKAGFELTGRVKLLWMLRDNALSGDSFDPQVPPALRRNLAQRELSAETIRIFVDWLGENHQETVDKFPNFLREWRRLAGEGELALRAFLPLTIDDLERHITDDPMEPVRRFIAGLVGPVEGSILDPVVGPASLLSTTFSADDHVERFGVAPNEDLAESARMSSVFNGQTANVAVGQSLGQDPFPDLRADLVLADVPVGAMRLEDDAVADPRWFPYGIPQDAENEWAYMEHALARLTDAGRAMLVARATTLQESKGPGARIRAKLVELGAVEAVFLLPSSIRRAKEIWPLAIWILRVPRPESQTRGVLIVDASDADPRELSSRDHYVDTYRSFVEGAEVSPESSGFAIVVSRLKLSGAGSVLTPTRWLVRAAADADPIELELEVTRAAERARASVALIADVGIDVPIETLEPAALLVKVEDLSNHKMIKLWTDRAPVGHTPVADEPSGHPILTVRHLVPGVDGKPETTFVPRDENTDRQVIDPGDVVVCVGAGGVNARVWQEDGWLLGKFVSRIKVKTDRLLPEFLATCLMSESNSRFVVTGAVRSQVDLGQLEIPMLDREGQARYIELAAKVAAEREKIALAVTRVDELAKALANAIATGKVDIGPADNDRRSSASGLRP